MSELNDFRKAKDQFFAQDPHSPLLPEQRRHFHGLEYFPVHPDLRFILNIDEFDEADKEVVDIITSTGDSRPPYPLGFFDLRGVWRAGYSDGLQGSGGG